MRVAILSDGIPPYVMGGMQKHSRLIAEHLAQRGIHVLLYHCVDKADEVTDQDVLQSFSELAQPNITVRTFPYKDMGVLPGHYVRAQRELSSRYLTALKAEKERIDFIYTKGFVGMEVIYKRKEIPYHVPIGVKFHGMNMFQKQAGLKAELSKYILRSPARLIMEKADYVFSYGGQITEIIASVIQDRSKIVEIPSGIDSSWVRGGHEKLVSEEMRRFLFVGRFDRVKGLPELYKAIDQLEGVNWTLELVGPIPKENQVSHPNVKYTGAVHDVETLKAIYDRNEILICPSISEGMPNVIMEAMARGLAIIATDVGATRLLVSENGLLMQPGSTIDILSAMKSFIDEDASKLADRRKRSVDVMRERFTWENIVEQLISFLSKAK